MIRNLASRPSLPRTVLLLAILAALPAAAGAPPSSANPPPGYNAGNGPAYHFTFESIQVSPSSPQFFTVADVSGHGYSMSSAVYNGPNAALTAGPSGNALDLNNAGVNLRAPSVNLTMAFTFGFYAAGSGGAGLDNTTGSRILNLDLTSSHFWLYTPGTGFAGCTNDASPGTYVLRSTGTVMSLFKNGTLCHTRSYTMTTDIGSTVLSINPGAGGLLDNMFAYPRALSDAEIASMPSSGAFVPPPTPVASGPTIGNSNTPTFTYSGTTGVVTCRVTDPNGGTSSVTPCASPYRPTLGSEGRYLVNFTQDVNGVSSGTASIAYVLDKTAPAVATRANVQVNGTTAQGASVTFSAPSWTDAVDGSGAAACAPASGSSFVYGATTVTCSKTDRAGNTGSSTFTVTVLDAPPVIAPKADMGPFEATGPSGAVVTYAAPAVSDVRDGASVASCALPSGHAFALGATTVTCTATDSSGNAATPVTFVVTVVDTTAPTIDVHPDVFVLGGDGTMVDYGEVTTHDAVDGDGIATCAPASGSAFSSGYTDVTCSAKDAAGNDATPSMFTVQVSQPPATPTPELPTAALAGLGVVAVGLVVLMRRR